MDLENFSEPVALVLLKHKNDVLPLTRHGGGNANEAAQLLRIPATELFPGARAPREALSGLLLLAGCWDESHTVAQELTSSEGSYWHAIAHRIEPDSANASYWFRRVGAHAIFPDLRRAAAELLENAAEVGWVLPSVWDPFQFVRWCDEARSDGAGRKELLAKQIQQAEWRMLFGWCALPK